MYDLDRGVYRKRELTREPLPMEKLRFANPREEAAAQMLHRGKIADRSRRSRPRDCCSRAASTTADSCTRQRSRSTASAGWSHGECSCDYFIRNRLHRGPCEHMLALRAAQRRGINEHDRADRPDAARRRARRLRRSERPGRVPPRHHARGPAAAERPARKSRSRELERTLRMAPPAATSWPPPRSHRRVALRRGRHDGRPASRRSAR